MRTFRVMLGAVLFVLGTGLGWADFAEHVTSFALPLEDRQSAAEQGLPIYPRQIGFDSDGNILLSGGFYDEYAEPGEFSSYVWLHRYSPTGALEEVLYSSTDTDVTDWYFAVAPDGTVVRSTDSIAIDQEGNRYRLYRGSPPWRIVKTSATGELLAEWEPGYGATGMFIGLDGYLYVNRLVAIGGCGYGYTLDRCELDGTVVGSSEWGGNGDVFAVDPLGRFYAINYDGCTTHEVSIQQRAADGTVLQQISQVDGEPFPELGSLRWLALTAEGDLATAEFSANTVHLFRYRRSQFADIGLWFWAHDAILACSDAGVVRGYDDGLYHPNITVTRDQMAVYIARALAGPTLSAGPAEPTFPDVPVDHWAYDAVEYCAANNIVQGYGSGTYEPDWTLTRAQMAVFIARSIVTPIGEEGLGSYTAPETPSFLDVPTDYWSYKHVEYLYEQGIVKGYPDYFGPGRNAYMPLWEVDRAQMAVYVQRAFGLSL